MEPLVSMKNRRKRWLVALLVIGAVLAGLLIGLVWIESPVGERFVQAKVLEAVRDAIEGRVEFDGLRLDGEHLHLENLKLFTAEGELVAQLASFDAAIRVSDLTRKRVTLHNVRLGGLRATLLNDDRGLNLSRAVRSKHVAASGTVDWFISLHDVALTGGAVALRWGAREFVLDTLEAKGLADVSLATAGVTGALELTAHLVSPLDAPVRLKLEADASKGATSATADLVVKDSQVKARAEFGTTELFIEELLLAHETMQALIPAWPLKVALHGKGSAAPTHVLASLSAGSATIETRAAFQLKPLSVEVFELTALGVDLEQLIGAQRSSLLEFTAKGSLADARAEQLTGSLVVDAKWHTPQHARLLTLSAHAEAKDGNVRFTPLTLNTPGAQLEVMGVASPSRLDLSGLFAAKDLALIPATVRAFAGFELPQLAGTGSLEVEVHGAAAHPAIKAVGQLSALRVGALAAQRLDVDLDLPDVTHPLDTDALLHASKLEVGDRSFEEVTLNVATRGRALDIDLATRGLGDLKVRASGTLDRDSSGAMLSVLQLSATSASWAMEAPAHVVWAARHTDIEPISLRDGAQHLVLYGRERGGRVTGELHAENVDLARLPRAISPQSLGLSGVFSLDVVAAGALPAPDADLTFAWARGGVLGISDLDVRTHAKWKKEHLVGTLLASASQGSATAEFDLPLLAISDQRAEPLSAKVKVTGVELERVARLLGGNKLPVAGVVRLDVVAGGTNERPTLDAALSSTSLEARVRERDVVLGAPRLELKTREDETLEASLSMRLFEGNTSLKVSSPFTLGGLREHFPTWQDLEQTRLVARASAQGVDLKVLDALGLIDAEDLAGHVGFEGELTGPALTPTGSLTVSLSDAAWPPMKKLDARVTITAAARKTSLMAAAQLAGAPVLVAQADFAANLRELATPAALDEREATGQISVLPLEISQLFDLGGGEAPPTGLLNGVLSFAGTLAAPVIRLGATVEALKFDKATLGAARLDASGNGEQQRVTLKLDGVGDLTVTGTLGLPLTLARVSDARAWQTSPLLLSLLSRDLDVAFLSGVHPLVRLVGGRLGMTGDLSGTLDAPRFTGDATWKKGRLALFGYGDYREVELDVHATNELVDLRQLDLKAGGGGAKLKGRLEKKGVAYRVVGEGSADKLPIISDDQLVATASLGLNFEGDVTPTLIDITSLTLQRVDVELPELKRKDLQDLDRPKDIIVLRGGARASRRRLREAKEAAAAAAAGKVSGRGFRAVINAPRNIWVRSSDLNVELGLSEAFRVERRATIQIFGDATVQRGHVEVIGRQFDVQKGALVRFAGPPLLPYVDVAAVHTNQKEDVKVTVTLTGRGTEVTPKATSEPPLPESEIYTLLATGRRELRRGSGASMTAADALSVVGQYATSQVKTMLARKVPIDVLNFEASDNFNKLKFDVGKYLSDSLYLGVSAQTGANPARGENPWAARLEYQFSTHWSLEAYAGTAPAAGADVMWSRDF